MGAAQYRRPGDRPRRPQGGGRPARPLHEKLNEGPDEPYLWAGNEPGFASAVAVQLHRSTVEDPTAWSTGCADSFGPAPDGEPGNDDLGAMASWYVWAALGLYPSTPGTPILTVSTPIFDRVVIALPGRQIHPNLRAGRIGHRAA